MVDTSVLHWHVTNILSVHSNGYSYVGEPTPVWTDRHQHCANVVALRMSEGLQIGGYTVSTEVMTPDCLEVTHSMENEDGSFYMMVVRITDCACADGEREMLERDMRMAADLN